MQVYFGVWMFFALMNLSNTQPRNLVVGVICGEHCDVSKQTVTVKFSCFSVVYQRVDTANEFDIFKAVRQFDNNQSVDAIVLLHNTTFSLKERNLLHAYNKSFIIWGDIQHQRTSASSKIKFASQVESSYCKFRNVQQSQPREETKICDIDIKQRSKSSTIVRRTLYNGPVILTSLMEHLKWKYVIILYEDATTFEMSAVLDLMSLHGIFCSLYHIDDLEKLSNDLTTKKNLHYFTLQEQSSVNFLVLCRSECARRALKEANDFDMKYNLNRTVLWSLARWMFALYDATHDFLKKCGPDVDHVLIVPVPELHLSKHNLFLPSVKTVLRESINKTCSGKETMVRKIAEISSEINIPCDIYYITTLAWRQIGREFINVGYIRTNGQVFITNDLFPNRNYGYNRRQFLVSVIEYPPFVIKSEVNGTAHYTGFCIDILKELATFLNFTYQISEVPDGNYGMVVERKTMKFNGLIGQVQRNEVDIIVGDIAITPDREQVMDFTFPFYYGFTTVVFKRPDSDRHKWRKLADPLKWQVVALVVATLLFASLIIVVLERNNPYYTATLMLDTSTHNCTRYKCGLQSFSGSVTYLFEVLLNEGNLSQHAPRSFTGRTFFSCWCLFGLVISGAYCGNLIASLTVIKEVKPFDTLSELVEMSGTYKWGTIGGTLWEQIFTTSDVPSFKGVGDGIKLFNKSDPGVLNKNNAYHIQKVKTEDNYAFIADDGSISIAMSKDCRLTKIKERFLTLTEAFGFPDRSPHVKIFAEKLMYMHDSGLIKQWKRKWWRSSRTCADFMKTEAKAIEILDVQSAFYLAAAGIFLSVIAFGVELIIPKIRHVINGRNTGS